MTEHRTIEGNKFFNWVDINNRKTCLKIAQQYYISKETGTKFRILRSRFFILIFKRILFLFFNLLTFRQSFNKINIINKKSFLKQILGLYKFQEHGLLHQDPSSETLLFQFQQQPLVSIIIAVHNHLNYTYNCLHSILLHTHEVPYEIILINDCSSDGTAAFMKQTAQIVYLENDQNMGFLRSCNKAAKVARGNYLCFLNNDTQVGKNWLSNLLAVFDADSSTGLVGAKLVYPYGLLQEAGGLVNYLGQPANYGRNDDPEKTEYNVLREADYCSGACITVLKNDFENLGGFDEQYVPAYYEDTDLSFAIRYQLHKKVYYQPLAKVIHFEGISSGKVIKAGSIKEYQFLNAQKFNEKWETVFASFPKTTSHSAIARKFEN